MNGPNLGCILEVSCLFSCSTCCFISVSICMPLSFLRRLLVVASSLSNSYGMWSMEAGVGGSESSSCII